MIKSHAMQVGVKIMVEFFEITVQFETLSTETHETSLMHMPLAALLYASPGPLFHAAITIWGFFWKF